MTIRLSEPIVERLKEIVFVANTPGYIVNRFAKEDRLLQFTRDLSSEDIVQTIKTIAQRSQSQITEDDAVTVVALTVALRNREPRVIAQLSDVDIPWLRWWAEILRKVSAGTRSSSWEQARVPVDSTVTQWNTSNSETSTETVTRVGAS